MKIGVTGGIGSGKSTFCRVLKDCGAFVVDADEEAKKLMVSNSEIKKSLVEVFGKKSYNSDGSLNRPYLAKEAFEKGRVEELNAIVHPILFKETDKMLENAHKEGNSLCVKEAALLLKYGRPDNFDKIILLLANKNDRAQRVASRDNSDPNHILARMNAQQDFDSLTHLADIVIENNGSLSDLKHKAEQIYNELHT